MSVIDKPGPIDTRPTQLCSKQHAIEHSRGVLNPTRLQDLLKSGAIKARRVGRRVAIDFNSLCDWMEAQPAIDYADFQGPKPPGYRLGKRKAASPPPPPPPPPHGASDQDKNGAPPPPPLPRKPGRSKHCP